MLKNIRTFNTNEFLDEYFDPYAKLTTGIKTDYGKFFMAPVQDLIKLSKLPIPPTRAHTHTIIFLTSGTATMNVGFHQIVFGKNQCLVVPAGQVFSYDKYEVNEGFVCTFGNGFLMGKIGSQDWLKDFEFLEIWGNPVITLTGPTGKNVASLLQRVLEEYSTNGLKNTNLLQSYFITALCELQLTYQPLSGGSSKGATALTNRFKQLLHLHIRTKQLVTDYACLLHVTPNHLSKCVREVTQKSATKWIDETIILEAKVLLVQTNDPISKIASELGIQDPSYFSRLFKKYENSTPAAYRKMIKTS